MPKIKNQKKERARFQTQKRKNGRLVWLLRWPSERSKSSKPEQGDSDAQYALGNLAIFYGDSEAAMGWYRKAAEQGHRDAQCALGGKYFYGCGVACACDRAVAAEWYRRAAEQGHPEAQERLAFAYFYGLGVARDREVGVTWYRKATEQGNEAATRVLAVALADQGEANAAEDGPTRAIADFGESRFPCNFRDWKGIGTASQRGLQAQGITEPVQLLGHFLALRMHAAAFEELLHEAGVVAAPLIRAQLQEWCRIHDVGGH